MKSEKMQIAKFYYFIKLLFVVLIRNMTFVLVFCFLYKAYAIWGIGETFGYCTFTRQDAIECMRKYVDTNKDGAISIPELRVAKRKYTPYSMQAAGWLAKKFHIDTSIRKVVENCRVDPIKKGTKAKDIMFTPKDFLETSKTCLPSQWALCQLKKVCDNAASL